MVTKTSLCLNISKAYKEGEPSIDVTPQQAEVLLAYHYEIIHRMTSLYDASRLVGSDQFELQAGKTSKITSAASNILGAVPGFGNVIQGIGNALGSGIEFLEKRGKAQDLEKVSEMVDYLDENGAKAWSSFTRNLADQLVTQQLNTLKTLTPEKAKSKAIKDLGVVTDKIFNGDFSKQTVQTDEDAIISNIGKDISSRSTSEDEKSPATIAKPLSALILSSRASTMEHH